MQAIYTAEKSSNPGLNWKTESIFYVVRNFHNYFWKFLFNPTILYDKIVKLKTWKLRNCRVLNFVIICLQIWAKKQYFNRTVIPFSTCTVIPSSTVRVYVTDFHFSLSDGLFFFIQLPAAIKKSVAKYSQSVEVSGSKFICSKMNYLQQLQQFIVDPFVILKSKKLHLSVVK